MLGSFPPQPAPPALASRLSRPSVSEPTAIDTVSTATPAGQATAATGTGRPARLPLGAALIAAALVPGLVRVVLGLGRPLAAWGDQAMIEIQVRQATHFQALVGPYSQFGWHHPGPAYFYALAPIYALAGASPTALVVGQLVINGVAAVATVLAVRHLAGEIAARWAAAVVGVFLLASGPSALVLVWNPNVIALPFLLTGVLAAGAATGSLGSLVWATVAGTFVVQSEIATAPVVAVTLAVAVVAYRRSPARRRAGAPAGGEGRWWHRGTRRLGPTGVVGLVVLVGLWLPPLYQEITASPGNLSLIGYFFLISHGPGAASGHSLAAATTASVDQLTWVALGHVPGAPTWARALLAVGFLVDAVAVVVAGRRLRAPLATALGAVSALGMVTAVIATTRIVGPIHPHLVRWTETVPLLSWLGTGVVVHRWWRRRHHSADPTGRQRPTDRPGAWASGIGTTSGALALVVLAALPAAFLARAFTRPLPPGDGQGSHASVPALVRQAQHRLDALGSRRVLVQIDDNRQWPVALGVAATLQGAGDHISLAYPYWKRLARWLRPDGRATAAVVLGDTAPGPTPPPGTVAFTSTQGPGAMWVTRLSPGAVSVPGPTAPAGTGRGPRPGQVPQAGGVNPPSSSSRVRTP